jgi:hypothetical protein
MKINANDQLDLKGSCLSVCSKESSIFTYNLFMLNTGSNQWISFTNNSYYFYTGLSPQTDLTIKEKLFRDFPSQTIWKIELNVYVPRTTTSGSTSILFLVNFPPINGSCDITPKNGTTNTLFSISCWNWFDTDGYLDSFSYYGKKYLSIYLFITTFYDYCLSLVIYFPPSTFQSLNNCFNLCLNRQFKFKPDFTTEDVVDEEKSMSKFITKLQAYDLFTLRSRLYFKLLTFAYGIESNKNSPIESKNDLNLNSIPSETVNEEATAQIINGSFKILPRIFQ